MKFNKIISLIMLFSLGPINARQMGGGVPAPSPAPKPVQAQAIPIPIVKQQPMAQPQSYAQALEVIKTKMSPDDIIINNTFTQHFVDFVTSFNFSSLETEALLEAGANIHIIWSSDDEENQEIITYVKNTIQKILQQKFLQAQKHVPAQLQLQPIQPIIPIAQKKPAQPIVQAGLSPLTIGTTRITMVQGDITKQKIDAIVNAANEQLLHRGGVAAAISKAAGPQLQQHSNTMPIIANGEKCPVGMAVITPAFNLAPGIKNIIHAVGPHGDNPQRENLLRDAYQNALQVAQDNGLRSIVFPAISTAIFGYDINEATPIAFAAVRDFIKMNPNYFDEVRFILLSSKDMAVYQQWRNELLK